MNEMSLTEYVIEINKIAEAEGFADPGQPYCADEAAWEDCWRDGLTPAEAWQSEKECIEP